MAITDAKATIGLPVGATNVLTSAGAAATVRYVPVGPNLVTNGGFETDTTGWNATASTLTRDTGTYKLGAASLKITQTGASTGKAVYNNTEIASVSGVTYHAGAWVYLNTATSVQLRLGFYTSGGTFISSSASHLVTTSGSWYYVTTTNTVPATAAYVSVYFDVIGTSQVAYVDGVTLQPCVPLTVSPYTVPTVIGDYAGGSFTYDVAPGAHYLGDVHVYDMDAQTDATLARSSYTRVYDTRHTFTGDVLVDNGVMRLWFKTGYAGNGRFRASTYANGSWQTFFTVDVDTAGDGNDTFSSFTLQEVSGGSVRVKATDEVGNTATFTVKRGAYAAKIVTVRTTAGSAWQDLLVLGTPRFVAYNASTVLLDDDVHSSNQTVAGTSVTEPYVLLEDDALPYLYGLGMAKKPSTLYGSDAQGGMWRDTAATTNSFTRTFWLIVMPWPWLTNGKYFVEAESATLGGTAASAADAGASGGNTCTLIANADTTDYTVVGTRDLPLGDYTLVVRAKDSAQVASDCTLSVYNTTDSASLVSSAKTLTASYAYYTADFTVDANEGSDNIRVRAAKSTATANTISVDYFLIVPRKRNTDSASHVHFPYDVAHDALMDTSTTHTIRKVT